uniref:Putative plant transposon protein domain-containing protein n=1 Tax=Nicotiana tabacum TaxID=4097 RepID=A0A1S3YKR3_TOBAC|nr:PREDICTED: uncharacterized protein LOC107777078 [Nicotiana tabacum]XP_016452543.1 PREDICTED: uncharacterized protein LOC107777078 [Nicotiana tabacum]
MPSRNETGVTLEKARVICTIIKGIPVNVGQLIVDEIKEVVVERTKSLFFLYLITHLCYEAEVEKRLTKKEKNPEKLIHPLFRKGAGNAQKKRKIDAASPSFGQCPDTIIEIPDSATGPCTAIILLDQGPLTLRYISCQVYGMETQVRQFVAGLPSRPSGEGTSTGPVGQGKVPTLSDLAKEQQAIKAKLGKIEQRQMKQREHENKKSKFLTKMITP